MGELIFNILLLLFFLAMGIYSFQIRIVDEQVGARTWPLVLLGAIVLMLSYKTYKIWKALPKEERRFSLGIFKLGDRGIQKFLASIAALLAYILVMPYLGYLLSTLLFFAGMAWLIGARRVPTIVLASLGVTAAVWAVFVWGLGVHPPRGIGFLEGISVWLEYLI